MEEEREGDRELKLGNILGMVWKPSTVLTSYNLGG